MRISHPPSPLILDGCLLDHLFVLLAPFGEGIIAAVIVPIEGGVADTGILAGRALLDLELLWR